MYIVFSFVAISIGFLLFAFQLSIIKFVNITVTLRKNISCRLIEFLLLFCSIFAIDAAMSC